MWTLGISYKLRFGLVLRLRGYQGGCVQCLPFCDPSAPLSRLRGHKQHSTGKLDGQPYTSQPLESCRVCPREIRVCKRERSRSLNNQLALKNRPLILITAHLLAAIAKTGRLHPEVKQPHDPPLLTCQKFIAVTRCGSHLGKIVHSILIYNLLYL